MISTERLRLVPIDFSYSNDLLKIWNDFEVIKYTYLSQIYNQEECIKRIEMFQSHTDPDFTNNFIVVLNDTAIGVIGFPIISRDKFECGFFYHYGREYWGHGYATEAAKALLEYVFNRYPDAIMKADAVSVNIASMQVLRKVGFQQTTIEEAGFQHNGYKLDLVHFITDRQRHEP